MTKLCGFEPDAAKSLNYIYFWGFRPDAVLNAATQYSIWFEYGSLANLHHPLLTFILS